MSGEGLRTVTTALQAFASINSKCENVMSAGIVLVIIPTLFLFLFLQKYILSGITAGAVKE